MVTQEERITSNTSESEELELLKKEKAWLNSKKKNRYNELKKKLSNQSEEERITSEVSEPYTDEVDVNEDYLRKYQYRKQTEFGSTQSDPQPGSKAEVMKRSLLKQSRVSIMIPLEQKEDPSIKHSVCLNGYRLDLPKNAYIEVPRQIAEVVMESLQQTNAAIMRGQITTANERQLT